MVHEDIAPSDSSPASFSPFSGIPVVKVREGEQLESDRGNALGWVSLHTATKCLGILIYVGRASAAIPTNIGSERTLG